MNWLGHLSFGWKISSHVEVRACREWKIATIGCASICFSLFCFLVKDTKFLGHKRQKFLLVDTYTKTVDSVEGVLWLATQTPNIFSIHLPATRAGLAPEDTCIYSFQE